MKKLLTLMMAIAMAATMAACSGGDTAPASQADEPSVVDEAPSEDETPEPADDTDTNDTDDAPDTDTDTDSDDSAAIVLPDISGYTKTEVEESGIAATMYIGDDGSQLIVYSMALNAAMIEEFNEGGDDTVADFNEAMNEMLGSMLPGAQASGEFQTVEGRKIMVADVNANGIDINIYVATGTEEVYYIMGVSQGEDMSGHMATLLKAL